VKRPPWPKPLAQAAFHGLAGEVVRTIAPESEADPAALLVTFLIGVGSAAGYGVGFRVGTEHHGTNEFAGIVGASSDGAKGMSKAGLRPVELAAPDWMHRPGLSTGEGLVHHVRDPTTGLNKDGEEVVEDRGVSDKRLLVVETEFAQPLTTMERPANTLSSTLRQAWDGGDEPLGTLIKNSSETATHAHISVIGHITAEELQRKLTSTDVANGFANRFLWVCAKRSQELPTGGDLPDSALKRLVTRTRDAITYAEGAGELKRSKRAESMWALEYPRLTRGKPGLLGVVTARARPHVMRVAVIYALLDRSRTVKTQHLKAALAVWSYAEASAAHIFGNALGDPVADGLLELLHEHGEKGLTRTQIRDLTNRHKPKMVSAALELLETHKLARRAVKKQTRGAPVTRWWAV